MDDWDIRTSDYLLKTPWVSVIHDRLRKRDSGEERDYYYLTSPGEAVASVALTDEGCVLLTRQYRHPLRRVIFDLPAGAKQARDGGDLVANVLVRFVRPPIVEARLLLR